MRGAVFTFDLPLPARAAPRRRFQGSVCAGLKDRAPAPRARRSAAVARTTAGAAPDLIVCPRHARRPRQAFIGAPRGRRVADGDIVKRAARMLREGATLKAEPCPYCGGVRVMRGGEALCVGCGSEPDAGRLAAAPAAAQAPHSGASESRAGGPAGGAAGGAAGPAVAVLEKRLGEAASSVPSSRGRERAALLDEVASLASAIRSLEAGTRA